MEVHYVLSGILLVLAVVIWFRPQSISTLRHYSKEQQQKIDLRRVRRTGSFGMAGLSLSLGAGSWMLHRAGVGEATLTVLGIVLLFVGCIAIMAPIETYNKNR